MSFSQLDLLVLGRRAFPQRIRATEQQLKGIILGGSDVAEGTPVAMRPNLAVNASFEFYDRDSTRPASWSATGTASLIAGLAGADGSQSMRLGVGESIYQEVEYGAVQAQGSVVISCMVRAANIGAFDISLPGASAAGPQMLIDPNGNQSASTTIPNDGRWYTAYRQFIVSGGSSVEFWLGQLNSGSGDLYIDAVKYERELGTYDLIEPTPFESGDYGSAVHIRNLSADNIIAGTLTVGGTDSSNPRISVLDDSDTEIVTIGDPVNGFYGIDVFSGAGIRVRGSGDIAVEDGGDITVSGGGSVKVSDGGSMLVQGTGRIQAGFDGGQRVVISINGISGYNLYNEEQVRISSADGRMRVLGPGGMSVEGGGSLLAGNPVASRLELTEGGLFAYDASGAQKVSISTTDGKVRVDADAFIVDGTVLFDSLNVSGEVTVGQDLRVGTNVLFVDQSQSNVGINKAPDPQFDLDVNGNMRAGGYIVGKHALQIKDATMIAHYDGPEPIGTDTTGDPTGHRGQVGKITGAVTYVQGKFQKGISLGSGATLSYPASGTVFGDSGTLSFWVWPAAANAGIDKQLIAVGDNNIGIYFDSTMHLGFVFNGTSVVLTTEGLWADAWQYITLTWSGTTAKIYRNGVLITTATVPSVTIGSSERLYVGTYSNGAARCIGTFDDLLVVHRALSQTEIQAIYESDAPVFAETSNWAWRAANTLAWADSEGLWAIDASGNAAFGVSGVNGKSWGNLGGTLLDKGDVLIGNSTQYVRWDASAGTMIIKGDGSGVTSIAGGNIQTGSIGADKINVAYLSAISGNLGTINAGTVTGALIQTAASGARVELSGANGFRSYNAAGSVQTQINSSGQFVSGNVVLDGGGLYVNQGGGGFYGISAVAFALTGGAALLYGGDRSFEIRTPADYNPIILSSSRNSLGARMALGYDFWAGGYFMNQLSIEAANYRHRPAASASAVPLTMYYESIGAADVAVKYGKNSTASHNTYIDLIADTTYTDYGLRFIRWAGPNGTGDIVQRGAGSLNLHGEDGGPIDLRVSSRHMMRVTGYNVIVDPTGTNSGHPSVGGLVFGHVNSGEGIISNRAGAVNQYGLDFWTNNVARMQISSGGAISAGEAPVSYVRLLLRGTTSGSGSYSIVTHDSGGNNTMYVRDDGYGWLKAAAWAYGSDEELKDDIRDSDRGLTDILKLKPKKFKYKKSAPKEGEAEDTTPRTDHIGFVAQELREALPELVTESEDGSLAIFTTNLIPVLVAALKELYKEGRDLRAEVNELKTTVANYIKAHK